MGSMGFGDFLSKMGSETNGSRSVKTQQRDNYMPPRQKVVKEQVEEDLYEEDYEEDLYKKEYVEEKPVQQNVITEDFRDKAYDYAQGVVKVLRTNFKDQEQRVVMLESLKSAIDGYMSTIGVLPSQPTYQSNYQQPTVKTPAPTMSETEWNNTPTIQESGSNSGSVVMNDLTGTSVDMNKNTSVPNGAYNKEMNLGLKVSPDGSYEADLSNVTAQDINEMKVLAGMIGKEAEQREKELEAAKMEVEQKLAEKRNQ